MARRWLLGALAGLLASAGAAAQGTPRQAPGPEIAAPGATASRPAGRAAAKPPPLEASKQPSRPPPPRLSNEQLGALAPVPNRTLEAPRILPQDRASLGPSVINRNMPGREQAADSGTPTELEEKLFLPGPGARLRLPFSY